jgi:hypothetical protein
LGVRLTTPPHKKILLRDLKRRPRPTHGCRADDDDGDDEYICIYVKRRNKYQQHFLGVKAAGA